MLTIQRLLINYNFSVRNGAIKYICIHDIGASSTAKNNRDYFNGGDRGASADFFVDSTNIIQCIDYVKNYGWAIGDGHGAYGITNNNSISIEMCLEANLRPSSATVTNTINLTQQLMHDLNIPLERVVRHYDASRKSCPHSFSDNNWALWNDFKKQLIPVVKESFTTRSNYCKKFQEFYNKATDTRKPLVEDGIYGKATESAFQAMGLLIKK